MYLSQAMHILVDFGSKFRLPPKSGCTRLEIPGFFSKKKPRLWTAPLPNGLPDSPPNCARAFEVDTGIAAHLFSILASTPNVRRLPMITESGSSQLVAKEAAVVQAAFSLSIRGVFLIGVSFEYEI